VTGRISGREVVLRAVRAALGTGAPDAVPSRLDAACVGPVLAIARQALATPLLHACVTRWRRPALQAEGRAALARAHAASARRYACLALRLEPVLSALAQAAVPAIVLKGMALADAVYGDPALRPMRDVDLLVPPSDVDRAVAVLGDAGYDPPRTFALDRPRRAAAMFLPRVAAQRGLILDVHWSLTDARAGSAAAHWAAGVHARAVPTMFGAAPAARLDATDAVVHTAVHLATHHGLVGLTGYCDLAMLAGRRADEVDWDRLVCDVRAARLVTCVGTVLDVAARLVGAAVPASVRRALGSSRRPRAALARLGLASPRARAWFALEGAPGQDYAVPLLVADRARDVLALVSRRLFRGAISRASSATAGRR
jgi:hypothetical protein